jgi:hypothetical protein
MPDTTYEVMVLSPVTLATMRSGIWYLESAHEAYDDAWRHFQLFAEQHPDRRLVVALVQSSYDAATGRFRDRVIEAREAAVPTFANSALRLPAEARPRLAQQFGPSTRHDPARPLPPRRARLRPSRSQGGRALAWWVAAAVALGVAGLAAVLMPLPV